MLVSRGEEEDTEWVADPRRASPGRLRVCTGATQASTAETRRPALRRSTPVIVVPDDEPIDTSLCSGEGVLARASLQGECRGW